jgi:glutamine synthetase
MELEKNEIIKEALGEHVVSKLIEAKKAEWDAYRVQVSDWEVENYLAKY